jgi:hypothetical protein
VPEREHRTVPTEDHDADGVVGLGAKEGVVQLNQEPPVLRVAGVPRPNMIRAIIPSLRVSYVMYL